MLPTIVVGFVSSHLAGALEQKQRDSSFDQTASSHLQLRVEWLQTKLAQETHQYSRKLLEGGAEISRTR